MYLFRIRALGCRKIKHLTFTYFRCRYPRAGREVDHHVRVPVVRRVPGAPTRSPVVRRRGPEEAAAVPRARLRPPPLDQGAHRRHAGQELPQHTHRDEEVRKGKYILMD